MHIEFYDLDYFRSLLSSGGWSGSNSDLKQILATINNKASSQLFVDSIVSTFYSNPKIVNESINQYLNKENADSRIVSRLSNMHGHFDENKRLQFVNHWSAKVWDFLPGCLSVECNFSEGYVDLQMIKESEQLSFSIIWDERLKISSTSNGKTVTEEFKFEV